jgi:carbamoyltransferase
MVALGNPILNQKLETYFENHFGHSPTFHLFHHHDCHAASAYYASRYDEALIITIDGSGDGVSIQISEGRKGKINLLHREERPNSLGIFYSMITQYCGFTKDSDEYKLMGLSSYGDRNKCDFSWLIHFEDGKTTLNTNYLIEIQAGQPSAHKDEMLFNKKFEEKLGNPRRIPKSIFNDFYKDVAASAQQHFENILLKIVQHYSEKTGLKKICLAGGSALNCVANQKLMNADFIEDIYVQPAASDAGISLGAAWLANVENNINPVASEHTYLGNSYHNNEIEIILKACNISYQKIDVAPLMAAKYISENKVIGWFQGKMEFGPRALGNRSILANACNPDMQRKVNEKIKMRESFRPFCPSVLEEDSSKYFMGKKLISQNMTITYEATPYAYETIKGVLHVDNTARIQTVNQRQNERFYMLLTELKRLIGHGVVLNTSFNLSHEPIVCAPRDALATFFSSGLDALFIGDFLVEK